MGDPATAGANGTGPADAAVPGGYRRVLVAYDGSPSAEDALALGRRLCDPAGGALILACVVSGRPWHRHPAGGDAEATEAMLAEARARLPAGTPVALRAPSASSPARGLTELAEHERADVIATGSAKGATGEQIGLARTAGRLLHGAPCAVAVAPPALRETGPFRHIGVAFDGSPESTAALAVAFAIGRRCGSAMTLYAALDDFADRSDEATLALRRGLQEQLDRAADSAPEGVNPGTVLLHGSAGPAIGEACDGVIDLLVVGSRGYGPLQRALLGSVSEELVARARHPVLVIPRQPGSAAEA